MAKRVIVTDDEGRARLAREMSKLKYHIGAMNKHGKLAKDIASEYRMLTATDLNTWRTKWADRVESHSNKYIDTLFGPDEPDEEVVTSTGYYYRRDSIAVRRRRRATALKRAKTAIRRERMK